MCLGHQTVLGEVLPTSEDKTFVLRIDVTNEEPSADAMVFEGHLMFFEERFIVLQEILRLAVTAPFA